MLFKIFLRIVSKIAVGIVLIDERLGAVLTANGVKRIFGANAHMLGI